MFIIFAYFYVKHNKVTMKQAIVLFFAFSICTLPSLASISLLSHGVSARDSAPPPGSIVYRLFHVDSLIVARYATVTVTSVVDNSANVSQELAFLVKLPRDAFISDFRMEVNGKTYVGIAREKSQALQEFEEQQDAGNNAGLVESVGTSSFIVRVNTAAESSANFILKYEELLVRRLSMYQQTISFNPGQVVEDSLLTVRVVEIQGISNSDVPSYVQTETMSDQEKIFTYAPTIDEQQTVLDQALTRDVAISYDVNHPGDESAGLFVVNECVFAHFFSPSGVESIPVDLVFIIDTSGSMSGTKIEQTRDALESIINKMRPTDRLSLLTFDSDIEYWKQELVLVSEFRQQAIQYARSLQADGSTNFNAGLLAGADILKQYGNPTYVQLMVILTDGQPTAGVTNPTEIQRNAEEALKGTRISLNCLGFGYDLNYELLEKLALNNNGIPRQIYEGNDAQDQLEGFFEEISSPILSEITITYSESVVESSTDTMFPLLFEGSELVVAGKLSCSADSITVSISGTGSTEAATFSTTVDISADTNIAGFKPSTPRLRAYLHIQQLLKKRLVAESEEEIAEIEARALGLALENNFVTELTSLIVVEENTNKTLNSDGDDLEAGPNGDLELDYDGGYGPGYFPSAGKAMVASISMILNAALLVAIYCH